jgi:hypothetical protein
MEHVSKIDPLIFDYAYICDEDAKNKKNGIKIYRGITQRIRTKLKESIKYHKTIRKKKWFTPLKPSTITCRGNITNIEFIEETLIKTLTKPTGKMTRIMCNFGEYLNPISPIEIVLPIKKKSKRGRKPKTKTPNQRKILGSGKAFSSQITFEIYNQANKKVYKIKLFRNGNFQVPGIRSPKMDDLLEPLRLLQLYLQKEFPTKEINVKWIVSVMRNYICRLVNFDLQVFVEALENLFIAYKTDTTLKDDITELMNNNSNNFPQQLKYIILNYIPNDENVMNIAEIQHNNERYFGLIVKFYKPVPWKKEKKTTIKLLRSGKINFDGCNSAMEAKQLYYWLNEFYDKHSEEIIHDPSTYIEDSSSDCSADSIYDESTEDEN